MYCSYQFLLTLVGISIFACYSNADVLTTDDSVVSLPKVQTQIPQTGKPVILNEENAQLKNTASENTQAINIEPDDQPQRNLDFTDQDLKTDARLADQVLGDALKAQNWLTIQHILSFYSAIPDYDPLMVLYMQGALDRHQAKYKTAIAAYQQMTEQAPELSNVKFDLAAMLFENKQYRQSKLLLEQLSQQTEIDPYIYRATLQFLAAANKGLAWQGQAQFGYKYNDNVNSAADDRILRLWGFEFIKSEAGLPQSDYALDYSITAHKDYNIQGNHYLNLSLQQSGNYYQKLNEWNEANISIKTGYKYQNYNAWFSFSPQINHQLLDTASYRTMAGTALEYGKWLKPSWQSIWSYTWLNKSYAQKGLEYYEGNLHALNWTNAYVYTPNTILINTITAQRDQLKIQDESSCRIGVGLGLIQNYQLGRIQLNANFNQSKYKDYNLWERSKKRQDKEYQLNAVITANQMDFGGYVPSLSYQYLHIDSNIPSFYSRKNNQVVLSLEKVF